MMFDTDILIWVLRGNTQALALIEKEEKRSISIISYMELVAGVRSKGELRSLKQSFLESEFFIIPLTENVGHRAAILMEEFSLIEGLMVQDALIAATALEQGKILATGNEKHFKKIPGLSLKIFRP